MKQDPRIRQIKRDTRSLPWQIKRRICAGNSVLSTDIRVISVQRELTAYRRRDTRRGSRYAPPPTAEIFSPSFFPFLLLSLSLRYPSFLVLVLPHRPASNCAYTRMHLPAYLAPLAPRFREIARGKILRECAHLTEGKDRRMAEYPDASYARSIIRARMWEPLGGVIPLVEIAEKSPPSYMNGMR